MSFLVFTILSIYLTHKMEKLESKLEDKQGLIRASRRSLALAEDQISNRNKVIEYQQEKINKLENKVVDYEYYITSNNYSNAEVRLKALKKLVTDYQSNNQF